jgi:hypothetical protein
VNTSIRERIIPKRSKLPDRRLFPRENSIQHTNLLYPCLVAYFYGICHDGQTEDSWIELADLGDCP